MDKLKWIHLGLTVVTIILLIILFFKLPKQMNTIEYLNAQQQMTKQLLREELEKIKLDSTIIERYYTIEKVTENQLTKFEQADSLKKDSLFWFYYLSWKEE